MLIIQKIYELIAATTAGAIDVTSSYLHTDKIQNHLDEQQKYYKNFYSWDKKAIEWTNFLKGALKCQAVNIYNEDTYQTLQKLK